MISPKNRVYRRVISHKNILNYNLYDRSLPALKRINQKNNKDAEKEKNQNFKLHKVLQLRDK